MDIAGVTVTFMLGKLADVGVKEVLRTYGVDEKVEMVNRELSRIQVFLKNADRKQIKDEGLKKLVEEVRDSAHSIEDVIDIFLMEISEESQMSGVRETIKYMRRKLKNLPAAHKLVGEIKQFLQKMKEMEEISRVRYGINNLGEGSGDIQLPLRPTILPDIDPDIVGFEADQHRIVKELLDETTKRRYVVSICGTGGLGKTTLAQKVYNCNDVKEQFGVRTWVTITEKFEIIEVSRKILLRIMGHSINSSDLPNETEMILTNIHISLRGKKYLIVLDDVWTTDLWTQIGAAFPDENNGSRVLVTTRFADVPKGMDFLSEPHKLQFLTEEFSRELLLKKVFPNHNPIKSSFDDLSHILDQFVHKCDGLPLALVVLGDLLSKQPCKYDAWSSVFLTMSWHDLKGINVHEIIGTSFEDLSFALKSCFMYFGAFPDDYTIHAPSLLRMWIAEGFITQEYNITLEETAERFLEDLVQRSMVQVERRSFDGSIETLRMHNLLRDLALQKAKKENFLQVYSNPNDKLSISRARRVAIHNPDCNQLILSPNLKTLLCFYNGSIPDCSKQRLLKVVSNGDEWHNIRNDHEENIIELGVFKGLTQLRYLSLRGRLSDNCDQEFFEKVISRMKFLQTLHIPWLSGFEFPQSAWNIKTLRHLCYKTDTIELPTSAKLTNLQTISMVRATQSWETKVPHIPNIRSLELLPISSPLEAVVTFLSTLQHLTNLYIMHGHIVQGIFDMRGFPFYNHLQSLKLDYFSPTKLTQLLHEDMLPCNLKYLDIRGYKFQHDIMPVLEKLPSLKALIINKAFESRKTTCSIRGFSQLEVLNLIGLSIEEWEIKEGAMPILKELEIRDCDELGVPQGLQYLSNLQKLMWRDVGNSKANLVRNLCQDVASIDLGRK